MPLPALGLGFAPGMTAAAKAVRILGFILIIAAALAVSYCQGRSDGRAHERAKTAEATVKVLQKAEKAGNVADAERVADTARQIEVEKRYEEVIEAAPGGSNSPAAVARACEQLRQAGYAGADLPAECGR